MEEQEDPINTGSDTMDNILRVILSSSMFLAMLLGFILDNTIPGTAEERGLIKWQNQHETGDSGRAGRLSVYDLPFITPWLQRCCAQSSGVSSDSGFTSFQYFRQKWSKYIPCLPVKSDMKSNEL